MVTLYVAMTLVCMLHVSVMRIAYDWGPTSALVSRSD